MNSATTDRIRTLALGLACVPILMTACSGPDAADPTLASSAPIEAAESPAADVADDAAGGSTVDVAGSQAAQPEAAPSIADKLKEAAGGKKKTKLRPPPDFPYKNVVRVETSVEPQCVGHGDTIELTVTAKPESSMAYQAVYSDNKSGAGAPMGEGYGGNDKGYADEDGNWTSAWVIAPNAPAGRARVDVYVASEGEWGYVNSRFAVADENGECPEAWLEGDR